MAHAKEFVSKRRISRGRQLNVEGRGTDNRGKVCDASTHFTAERARQVVRRIQVLESGAGPQGRVLKPKTRSSAAGQSKAARSSARGRSNTYRAACTNRARSIFFGCMDTTPTSLALSLFQILKPVIFHSRSSIPAYRALVLRPMLHVCWPLEPLR